MLIIAIFVTDCVKEPACTSDILSDMYLEMFTRLKSYLTALKIGMNFDFYLTNYDTPLPTSVRINAAYFRQLHF